MTTNPAADPNNPANWLGASFEDGSGFSFGNTTGTPLNPLPALPQIGPGASSSVPSGVLSQGGAPSSAGSVLGSIAAPVAPSNPAKPSLFTVNPSSAPATGSISDYFLRGIIIILGFIFVAVGLNMFRPGIVPDPRNLRHGAAS